MPWDEGLTGVHLQIAESDHPRIGVLAGPGTGKTTYGLLRRVARLLETDAATPGEILLLTFTRTAAHDLVDKLAEMGVPRAEQVRASTLHSYCLGMLQREAVLRITLRTPRMLLEHEENLLLRDLQGDFGTLAQRRERLLGFEAGWARATTDHPGLALDPEDRSFEAQVVAWLRHHRAMLIGEIVPVAFRFLRENPASEERVRYKHVVVDEYQDLNTIEQQLVEMLISDDGRICVAGDDDQSIYGFRYAHPEGIVDFTNREDTEAHTITDCGRCPDPVLRVANALMANALPRSKPPLVCATATPGELSVVQWSGLHEEVTGLVSAIAYDIQIERRQPGDVLVLVNRRQVGYMIRSALAESGIEAHSFFRDDALKRSAKAQQSIAALWLLSDPNDRPSLRVWLGGGDAEGRMAAYARLREAATHAKVDEFELLRRVRQGSAKLNVPALARRLDELEALLRRLEGMALAEVVDELFPAGDPDVEMLREPALAAIAAGASDVTRLLEELIQGITQPEVPQRPDFVRVMSLHKSKGLTSPVVVASACDRVIPTIKGTANEREAELAFEEGRRLFYVALTRASDELVISYPFQMRVQDALGMGLGAEKVWRSGGDLVTRVLPTPYLAELGPDRPDPVQGEQWLELRTRREV